MIGDGSTEQAQSTDGALAQRAAVERAIMDMARARALREPEQPRRRLQYAISLVAALAIVGVVLLGLDAFLTAMQKYMETKIVDPAPSPTAPMPAFAVQPDVGESTQADPDSRSDRNPAPEPAAAGH